MNVERIGSVTVSKEPTFYSREIIHAAGETGELEAARL